MTTRWRARGREQAQVFSHAALTCALYTCALSAPYRTVYVAQVRESRTSSFSMTSNCLWLMYTGWCVQASARPSSMWGATQTPACQLREL